MLDVTGSLQIKNKIYQAVLSYKKDGKWKTKWVSTKVKAVKGNKKKAENEPERIRLSFQDEINSDNINNEEILFIDYMKKWLKMIKSTVEESTFCGYSKQINGRMTKYFEGKEITLQKLKPQDIQDFYQYLIDEGLSGNTVKHYHANINKACSYAVKTDIIPSNPANKVDLPKVEPYQAEHYTNQEILELLKMIEGTKLETPVILGCYYGLRREEVVGLRWKAIDFVNKTITINHTITQMTENHVNKLIIKDSTKTKSNKFKFGLDILIIILLLIFMLIWMLIVLMMLVMLFLML